MRKENGHKLELPNCSESTLKCCDFIWPEMPTKTGSCLAVLRPLELKESHENFFKLRLFRAK